MKQAITLAKFLTRYYGIQHPNILNLSHNDVKILFEQVERSSFEYAEQNPDMVAKGEIVFVEDKYNVIPYKAPQINMDYEFVDMECSKTGKKKPEVITEEDLKTLSKDELLKKLKEYRAYCHYYKLVVKEVKLRGMKERKLKDDKYKRESEVKCFEPQLCPSISPSSEALVSEGYVLGRTRN